MHGSMIFGMVDEVQFSFSFHWYYLGVWLGKEWGHAGQAVLTGNGVDSPYSICFGSDPLTPANYPLIAIPSLAPFASLALRPSSLVSFTAGAATAPPFAAPLLGRRATCFPTWPLPSPLHGPFRCCEPVLSLPPFLLPPILGLGIWIQLRFLTFRLILGKGFKGQLAYKDFHGNL